MIKKIKNKLIFKNKVPMEIEKNESKLKKIEETWENFIQDKDDYFNGDIFVVTNIKNASNQYIFEIGKAKFADLVYAKQNDDLTIHSLFASVVLKTKDNYYMMIRNNHNTINLIGGMASEEDFENGNFNPEICLEREIKEEIGLSLKVQNDILNYEQKYIKIPNHKVSMYPCGIIFTATLNYTKLEFEKYFEKFKSQLDNEIKELIFYTKENYLNLNNEENKESYLIEVIDLIENEIID